MALTEGGGKRPSSPDPFSQREKGSRTIEGQEDKTVRMTYKKRDFARYLRKESTPAEKKLWSLLKNRQFLGLKFRRQHVIEGFVADFYCDECKLAIELDGGVHDRQMQKDYDELRDEVIQSEGINLIRIKNQDIEKDVRLVLKAIKNYITELKSQTQPFSLWERGVGR